MLINKPEPIVFDFESRWRESLDLLDNEILFTSGRTGYPITDPDGELLIDLLQQQYIHVHAQKYLLTKEPTPEDHRVAEQLASLINKSYTGSIVHALRIYGGHEPQNRRNEYNALFYPALKAYVRFGDLYPKKLLAMLGEGQCDGVMLFRDCADSSTEDRFFSFALGIPKADYLTLIEQVQAQRAEEMALENQAASAHIEGLFPEVAF
jgi:hypothetical protein